VKKADEESAIFSQNKGRLLTLIYRDRRGGVMKIIEIFKRFLDPGRFSSYSYMGTGEAG
jgi:hypothetical protein